MKLLEVDKKMSSRYLNDGFSGGEKKRLEILQMAMLKPSLAILDETDSGLDIDALQVVAKGVNHHIGPDMGAIVITHYQRILDHITPSHVHVLIDGRIVRSGGPELAHELERVRLRVPHGGGLKCPRLENDAKAIDGIGDSYKYGFHDDEKPVIKVERGLTEDIIRQISAHKGEPEWMLEFRLKSYEIFRKKPMPGWGADLSGIDFENIFYYLKPVRGERPHLGRRPRGHQEHVRAPRHPAGRAQVPRRRRRPVRVRGRLPQPPEGPLGQGRPLPATPTRRSATYPELFREHWATVIPANDNKFSALNSAVWSGGSFIYVPPRASRSSCRCRPTSASTRRTWASSSGR